MTPEQRAHQEELKIKLRTAMADTTLLDEMDQVGGGGSSRWAGGRRGGREE